MIVLDTHALVWWVHADTQLSSAARKAIRAETRADEGLIVVSAISAWEIALLVEKGRLTLSMSVDDWMEAVAEIESVRIVPVDAVVAIQSTRLPGEIHPDPADRMIIALSRHLSAPLVTADGRIRAYKHVKTIW
ncbi:type II toxin-antitoxin system VapC family toxin [Marinihelvus fidelis]|uniref:Type II toxin-antitoxin system VapC family toxin n=1 Tax=Marinihelvus fidelis TaxID=2613842 RepID=A0A5N0T637_9GAMM|nr:type II toxin-antitoxin system VapC family toxin [Marinihelvus fidelis]KAA9130515.1 type II toxin-antitoxin system VapC family toxin [Marinihelvus fidelis]